MPVIPQLKFSKRKIPALFAWLNVKFPLNGRSQIQGTARAEGTESEFMLHSYTLGIHEEETSGA